MGYGKTADLPRLKSTFFTLRTHSPHHLRSIPPPLSCPRRFPGGLSGLAGVGRLWNSRSMAATLNEPAVVHLRRTKAGDVPEEASRETMNRASVTATPPPPFPRKRRSVSAEASRAAEIERLRGMSVEQRIQEALSLRRRFRDFIPPRKDHAGGTGI